MNDLIEKVKQGLKCWGNDEKCKTFNCPMFEYIENIPQCRKKVFRDALSVIESLQSENKILSENCDGLSKQRDDFAQTIHEQKMEIERLQPKKGKWLDYAGDQMCSVCGSSYSDLFPEYDRTPFCPHCGAKMEGGDDDG